MSSSAPSLRKPILLLILAAYPARMPAQDASPVLRTATPVREADAVCGKCHQEIFRRYLEHPWQTPAAWLQTAYLLEASITRRQELTIRYRIRMESLWLNYSRPGDPGLQGSQKLDYFLGSGHLGITYLYSVNGYFLESPVAYYAESKAYDMKPGLGRLHDHALGIAHDARMHALSHE